MSTKKLQIIGNIGGGGSVSIDATLTKEGYAADAKVVGDKLIEKVDKSIFDELVGDTSVAEQIENAKSLETTPEDIIEWMSEENIITPLASSSGEVYLTNDNKIIIL